MMPPRRMGLARLNIEAHTRNAVSLKTALYASCPEIFRIYCRADKHEHERNERSHRQPAGGGCRIGVVNVLWSLVRERAEMASQTSATPMPAAIAQNKGPSLFFR